MIRYPLTLLSAFAVALTVTGLIAGPTIAQTSATGTPTVVIALLPTPTALPTVPSGTPSIRITKVDMFRHVGGEFFSTRQIRIGHLMRWIVYFHLDHPEATLPSCHVAVSHDGHVFYEDAMWRKRGKNYFFLDGRFRSVYGPTLATFTLRLGTTVVTSQLLFKVKLPKF